MYSSVDYLEREIGLIISKILKTYTGRGPRKITTYINRDCITVRILDFLSEMELNIMVDSKEAAELIYKFRYAIHGKITAPLFTEEISELMGTKILHCFVDIHPQNNEAVFVIILARTLNE
jgi:uncharacterized protein YbcI